MSGGSDWVSCGSLPLFLFDILSAKFQVDLLKETFILSSLQQSCLCSLPVKCALQL